MTKGPIGAVVLSLCLSCSRDRAAPSPAGPLGSAVPASTRVVRDRLSIAFELRPVSGAVTAPGEATAVFTITDAETGAPVRGLRPLAWMSRRGSGPAPDEAACKGKVKSYLAGLLSARADVDMSAHHVWAVGEEGTIAVIDPTLAFSRTRLEGIIQLGSRPADWVSSADRGSVWVTLPETGELAIIDARRRALRARVPVGGRPTRVVATAGGRRAFVGDDEGGRVVIVDTRAGLLERSITTGAGHQEIAFADHGTTAWITSSGSAELRVVDVASLDVLASVPVGRGAIAVAASELAQAVYVASGEGGEVTVIDTGARRPSRPIALKPGLSSLRIDPSGRFGFAAFAALGELAILDLGRGRVARTLGGLGAPDSVAFTRSFGYVRQAGAGKMTVIELDTLDREGSPAVIEVPLGPGAPAPRSGLFPLIAPTPEGNSVMAAGPGDDNLYYFVEGMMAPVGENRSYTRGLAGLLVVDHTLGEIDPGVYGAGIRLDAAGTYDVALLLDNPRVTACLEEVVPGRAAAAPLTLEPLFDPRERLPAGAPATLRFRLLEGGMPAPIAASAIEILILRVPGNHRFGARPAEDGEGALSVTFTPPVEGRYRVLAAVPSRGVGLGKIPYLEIGISRAGEGP